MIHDYLRWLDETVRFYRELGYLSQYVHLPTEFAVRHLFTKIQTLVSLERHDGLTTEPQMGVPGSIQAEQRVLIAGGIGEVCPNYSEALEGSFSAYVELIDSLSRSSRGVFNPEQVRETWDLESERGPTISFSLDGELREYHAEFLGSCYDLNIYAFVDLLLARKGYRILKHVVDEGECIELLFIVNMPEQYKLENERGITLKPLEW